VGRAGTELNHAEEGVAELRQGINAMQSSGMRRLTLSYAVLAEGCAKAGCTADGLAVAAEGLESSRHQQAKWWELRATTSLARLLATQGRRNEARAMLAEIYNWFTEGFDLPDLKDAKALLDQLTA
jgi:predicted ATPase